MLRIPLGLASRLATGLKGKFAEVKLTDEDVRQQAANNDCKKRDQRIPYIKLTYPNGVTLNLPTSIDVRLVEQYIRIKV